MTDTTPIAEPQGSPPAAPAAGTRARPAALLVLTVAVIVVLVAGVALAGAAIGRSTRQGSPDTITVSATGTVMGVPDTIQFTLGVQTTRATAPAALAANSARILKLERLLKGLGVPKSDLQTSNLDIWEDTNRYGHLSGFTVQNTLDVTMHGVTKAGYAIEAGARSAGNGVIFNGLTLSISNDSKLLAEARARAMQAARSEASDDARGAGASVSSVIRINDQETVSNPSPVYYGVTASAELNTHAFGAPYVPIRAGTEPVTVQVTVVYSLSS